MDSIKRIELEAFTSGELEEKINACVNLIFSAGLSVLHIKRYTTPSKFYNASIVFSVIEQKMKELSKMYSNYRWKIDVEAISAKNKANNHKHGYNLCESCKHNYSITSSSVFACVEYEKCNNFQKIEN